MAYLRKHPRSPFWVAVVLLPNGIRTNRSTKTRDRKLAMKMATEWEDAGRKRITEAQARRVLSDIYEDIHGSRLDSPSVADYVKQWLARKTGETAVVTAAAYKQATSSFVGHLGDKAEAPIHYVTPAQIAAWRDASAAKATARTANNKLKIIRVLFQSAWRDGLLTDNPAAKISVLKTEESGRRPFTVAELKALLGTANTEWRGLILAGIYTGQRLKDIASLTWANVDMERDSIRLRTSKTGRAQVIPIASALRTYLAELPGADDPTAPVFPSSHQIATEGRDVSPLSQQFHSLLVAVGLAKPRAANKAAKKDGGGRSAPRETNGLSFHSLRHTATSWLKNAGVSEAVAMDIIGHDTKAISAHYTHTDEAAKRAALVQMPDITAS